MPKSADRLAVRLARSPEFRLALCVAIAVGIHVASIGLGGWLLWANAGSNVSNGSTSGQVLFVLTMVASVVIHACTAHWTVRSTTAHLIRGIAQASVAGVLLFAWWATTSYYVGWLSLLSILALLVDSVLRLLAVVLAPSRDGRGEAPRVDRAAAATAGVGIVAAAAALVATAPIHVWDGMFLNNLVMLLVTGTLIGYIGSPLITRLIEAREPVGE